MSKRILKGQNPAEGIYHLSRSYRNYMDRKEYLMQEAWHKVCRKYVTRFRTLRHEKKMPEDGNIILKGVLDSLKGAAEKRFRATSQKKDFNRFLEEMYKKNCMEMIYNLLAKEMESGELHLISQIKTEGGKQCSIC